MFLTFGSPGGFSWGSLTGSLALSVAYGLNVESEDDEFYAASVDAMSSFGVALVPGNFLVDSFPIRTSSSWTISS